MSVYGTIAAVLTLVVTDGNVAAAAWAYTAAPAIGGSIETTRASLQAPGAPAEQGTSQ